MHGKPLTLRPDYYGTSNYSGGNMHILERERLTAKRGEQICTANGYEHYVIFPDGHDSCVTRFGFNYAILSDLTEWGYGDRWCFADYRRALAGLLDWTLRSGDGEPVGWHRHPASGRRRPGGDASREVVRP